MVQFSFPLPSGLSLKKAHHVVRMVALGLGMLTVSVLAGFSASGQDLVNISVGSDGIIRLPEGETLQASYLLDCAGLQFKSDADMIAFFSTKSGENYLVRAVPHLNKAILHLQTDKNPTWTREEWNAHLAAQSAIRPLK